MVYHIFDIYLIIFYTLTTFPLYHILLYLCSLDFINNAFLGRLIENSYYL
jgi:hypothetical protein